MYISATEYVSSYKMRTELQAKLRRRRLRTDEDDSQVPNDAVAREEFTLSARGKYLELAEVSKHGKVAWRLSTLAPPQYVGLDFTLAAPYST